MREKRWIKIKLIDLTGQRFGRLEVLSRANDYIGKNGRKRTCWNCKCDCGNECIVRSECLKSGATKSCGCYNKEVAKNKVKKYNQFDMSNEYGICYAGNTNDKILFDKEDFELIKDLYWIISYVRKDSDYKRVRGCVKHGQYISFHNAILDVPNGYVIDHINGNTLDNRKENLRICTQTENMRNRRANTNNKLNIKGVCQIKNGSYCAKIQKGEEVYYIGLYKTKKEAADAYDVKAKELFGEFARLNNYTEGVDV